MKKRTARNKFGKLQTARERIMRSREDDHLRDAEQRLRESQRSKQVPTTEETKPCSTNHSS